MILAILFLGISLYIFYKEIFEVEEKNGYKCVYVKGNIEKNEYFRYRISLGLFSLILSIFSFLNVLIY